MKLAISTGLVLCIFRVSASLSNGWDMLPARDEWNPILKSFKAPEVLVPYVNIYITPFYEIQAAERSSNVTGDVIKNCYLAMLDLVLTSCENFNMTESVFNGHQRDEYRKVLDGATRVFMESSADQVQPVFQKRSLRNFMFQRFNDMIVASDTYRELDSRVRGFTKDVHRWHMRAKNEKADRFKYLLARNLDLVEVQKYSVDLLQSSVNVTMNQRELRDFSWRLHSLGNDASAPLYLAISSTATFTIVALAAVMIF